MTGQRKWLGKLSSVIVIGGILLQSSYALAAPMELSLADSLVMAEKNNPAAKMAQEDKDVSRWNLEGARAGFGPTLTYTHTASDTNESILSGSNLTYLTDLFHIQSSSTMPPTVEYDNKLQVSMPVYTGGKVESQVKQAKLDFQIADLEIVKTAQQLKLDTTNAYFAVLQAQDLVGVNQESVNKLQAHLNSVQTQYDAGAVNKSEVLRSVVELGRSQQELIKAQNQYEITIVKLKKLLGLPRSSLVTLKDTLTAEPMELSLEECLQNARDHRPDFAQAKAQIHKAEAGTALAKSQNLPQVNLKGDTDWNDSHFPGLKNGNWGISIVASVNIFDSGLTKSMVKASEISTLKAQEKVTDLQDTILEEVNEAFLNLKEAEKRIAISQTVAQQAEEDYKIAGVRYEEGAGTNLDVIDAQQVLTKAKSDHVQALYDYNTDKAALRKAMGML